MGADGIFALDEQVVVLEKLPPLVFSFNRKLVVAWNADAAAEAEDGMKSFGRINGNGHVAGGWLGHFALNRSCGCVGRGDGELMAHEVEGAGLLDEQVAVDADTGRE